MNKIRTFLALVLGLSLAFAVRAAPSWAAINTDAYAKDADPSTANMTKYAAYYCEEDMAKDMFGSSNVADIETYLAANFAKGKADMAGSGTALTTGYYEAGEYTFAEYFADEIADGNYLAVAFYGNEAYRVFGGDDVVWDSGNLTFGDAGTSKWLAADVPEPTSGLLLLFGVAGLMLMRRGTR